MKKISYGLGLICIALCAITLYDARALFAPYLIAALFSIYCMNSVRSLDIDRKAGKYRLLVFVSVVAALFITFANHALWLHPDLPDFKTPAFVRLCKLYLIFVLMSGTFTCVMSVLSYIVYCKDSLTIKIVEGRKHAWLFFVIPFVIISCIYLVIWYCCYYPGLVSLDTLDQIGQIFSGKYSNHQPFYHTLILGVFLNSGLNMFGNINMAVSFYVIFQVVFMAATFAFTVYNMAKLRLPAWICVVATMYYALMPFHIMYSFTVWKDVFFGAFVTLFIIFFVRIMNGIGISFLNYVGFSLCGPVICLIRSNGLFAYVFIFLSLILLARKNIKLILIMLATIIAAFIMKHNVLSMYNVTQPDTVESLSIPLQQIARVFYDGGDVAPDDMEMLSQIIDVSAIADNYDGNISDPIKEMIRDYGNEDFLSDNMKEYALVYLHMLARNPVTFVVAWVDSTCGYWNSGYNYWVWYWDVEPNTFGIARTVHSNGMLHFMDEYLWLFYNNRVLQVFTAIGFLVWILLALFAKNINDGNRCGIIATVPLLAILLSLFISSPVFSEFRYVYALYCSIPVIIAVSCTHSDNKGDLDNKEGNN